MRHLKGIILSGLFLLLLVTLKSALAEENEVESVVFSESAHRVTIADPFIELHTGAGAAYPIFHVIDRGTLVTVLRRRTDWFQIQTEKGITGWASRNQMRQTLLPSGEKLEISDLTEGDFSRRQWVLGITGGEFESAPVFTIFTAYAFTENLAAELAFGQSVGSISSSTFWKTNLVMQPLPDLTYSPYLTLGLGQIKVDPSATLIVPNDETNELAQVGVGFQRYISRSFLLRFELNEYIIFSSNTASNKNEEVNEWKIGFAVFF